MWWVLLIAVQGAAETPPPHLRVGVLSFRDLAQTTEQWAPLFAEVGRAAGVELEVVALDYEAFTPALDSLDLVFTNPEHFTELRPKVPLSPVATLIRDLDGKPALAFSGVIFTRAEAPLQTLGELSSVRVAAVDRRSLGGYLLQRWELVRAGSDADASIFTGTPHDLVVRAVLEGRADVGFVRTGVIEQMMKEGTLAAGRLRVIGARTGDGLPLAHSTTLVPEWPLAISTRVSLELRQRLTIALLQVDHGAPAAAHAGIWGFAPPADYDAVGRLTREARHDIKGVSIDELFERYRRWVLALGLALVVAMAIALMRVVRASAAVKASAREREQLLSSLGEGVCGVDTAGRITFVNRAATQLFGLSERELLGGELHTLTHHHYRDGRPFPMEDCDLFATLRDGQTRIGESWFFRADGTGFPVWRTVSALRSATGLTGAVVTFLDLSDKNRIADELAHARDEAQASSEAKSRFLAMMSHEVRTPLNGVLGMAQLLALPDVAEADRLDYAHTITQSGKVLLAILNDLLDLAKVEAGKLELVIAPVAPAALAREVRELFTALAAQRGLTLTCRFEGDDETRVFSDAVRLRQMVSNYVTNAIKFTERGEVEVRLWLEAGSLGCAVRDTGAGMTEAQRERLFSPFTQLPNGAKAGGTGLGLTIVRHLARLMGGETSLVSEPGKGSTFSFRVPAPVAPNAQPLPAALERLPQLGAHVLVVDDNAINRKVVEGMLTRLGCSFTSCVNGAEAIEAVERGGAFDLVLMDCHMPVCDGFEATSRLRRLERSARLPIVALTASAFDDDRQHCLAVGMNDVLTKPVVLPHLHATLAACLTRRPPGP